MSHANFASIFSPSDLPAGFSYPISFLEFIAAPPDELYPWVFIDPTSDHGRLVLQIAAGKKLVPFAFNDLTDGDTACFVTRPVTGVSEVEILVLDGSDRSYSFSSFGDWLRQARQDAEENSRLAEVRFEGWAETKRIEKPGSTMVFIRSTDGRVQYILFRFVEQTWQGTYRSGSFSSLDEAVGDAQLNEAQTG